MMNESNTCEACGMTYVGGQCPSCGHVEDTGSLTLDQITDPDESVSVVSVDLEPNQAALIVLRGATPGETLILEGTLITVGRDANCDLFLDDITVSRKHAQIQSSSTTDGTVWFVVDTSSLNGTYVNRDSISDKTLLADGDEIQFGKFKFTFVIPGEK